MPENEDIQPTNEPVETPEPEVVETPEPVVEETHPLEPGGKRFAEVYGEMKDARREAQELRERLARVEGQIQSRPEPAKEPTFYTHQQLQMAVDQGKITPGQMSDQLAWQRAQEMRRDIERTQVENERKRTAVSEINQYIEKIPSLMTSGSPEFNRVARAAREIAEETGKSMDDPVVQRRALREAFGTIDKVTAIKRATDMPRGQNNMDTTPSGGGSIAAGGKVDPLRNVPQVFKDHWKRLGYTQERMIEEAKFIKPRR